MESSDFLKHCQTLVALSLRIPSSEMQSLPALVDEEEEAMVGWVLARVPRSSALSLVDVFVQLPAFFGVEVLNMAHRAALLQSYCYNCATESQQQSLDTLHTLQHKAWLTYHNCDFVLMRKCAKYFMGLAHCQQCVKHSI